MQDKFILYIESDNYFYEDDNYDLIVKHDMIVDLYIIKKFEKAEKQELYIIQIFRNYILSLVNYFEPYFTKGQLNA